MQSTEMLVYFMVALIIGGIMIGAFRAIDYKRTIREIRESKEDKAQFKVDSLDFASELARRWQDCGYGAMNRSYSIYVKDEGSLRKVDVVKRLFMLNHCGEIDCNNRTNKFWMANELPIPELFSVTCINNTLVVDVVG